MILCNRFLIGILISLPFYSCAQLPSPLTLAKVLKTVDRCYPKILIARLEIRKAQGEYLSALGKFDPSLKTNLNSHPVGGYINRYIDNQITIPTLNNGLKFFGGYRRGTGRWPIYYQNYLTNSGGEYRVGLSFPLLRDRLTDRARTELFSKAEAIKMRKYEVASTKIKIYQETVKSYWRWVEAGLQLKTYEYLFNLAKTRQEAIVKQAKLGDLPQLAVAENLQLIVQREQLVNQGQMTLMQAAIDLSLYYRDKKGRPKMPTEQELPQTIHSKPMKLKDIKALVRRHPALCQLKTYAKIIGLRKNLARNDLLPNLEATAYTYKQYGTGGYPLLIPQAAMVGLRFNFPILQREAKGRLISVGSEIQQVKTQLRFLYEQLYNQLSNYFVTIKVYYQQVELLNKELKLAKQVQEGEIKKFYEGDSTLFLVNQREQATGQVKINLIAAEVNLQEMKDLIRFFSSTPQHKRCALPLLPRK